MRDLSPEAWARVQEIVELAAGLAAPDRAAYLRGACGDDPLVRQRVQAMLDADEMDDGFLETPAGGGLSPAIADDHVELARYRILERIGAGGMGVVYRAERADGAFDQHVAVKILRPGLESDDLVRRFQVERQTLANLRHANVAKLLDGGVTADGRPYIVMELIEGMPIDRYCREHALGLRARLELFGRVCDAVAHAHRSLIVHRDLKPSNVLVDADGAPKLLDFGVAKVLDPSSGGDAATMTVTGERLFTPRYASPEQILGGAVTTATDVHALGVMLYELLTGCAPYVADTEHPTAIARSICETEPPPPSAAVRRDDAPFADTGWARALRGDVDTIVMKAIRKEPERRYPTVDALLEDLRRHLARQPILARRPSAAYRLATFVRRRRGAVIAGGVGSGLAGLAAIVLAVVLILMPRWSAEAVREARTILLGPEQQAAIYDAVFFLGRTSVSTDEADQQADVKALARAERAYDRGVRLAPLDTAVRRERDVVRAARLLRAAGPGSPIPSSALASLDPVVAAALDSKITPDRLSDLEPSAMRELGLVLVLARPGRDGIEALRAYETVARPDPLVEGLLGQLYLTLGHADLAYPRIRAAFEAYPESRAITLALAEAACGVRDAARAGRLVDHAATLPGADPFDRIARVRAIALAAAGDVEAAHAAFEIATRPIDIWANGATSRNPVSCYEYGRFLEGRGDLEGAAQWLALGVRGPALDSAVTVPMAAYVRCMERWIDSWSPEEREQRFANAASTTPGRKSLASLLRLYTAARAELVLRLPRIAVFPDEAARFAKERASWSQPTAASRLADALLEPPREP